MSALLKCTSAEGGLDRGIPSLVEEGYVEGAVPLSRNLSFYV